jgi:hypothetical protein
LRNCRQNIYKTTTAKGKEQNERVKLVRASVLLLGFLARKGEKEDRAR